MTFKISKELIKNRFSKKNVIKAVIISVAFSFTLFFFSGADIFLLNQRDFSVNAVDVLLPMLICAVASSLLCSAILFRLLLIHEIPFIILSDLLGGLTIAGYCQSMFMNGNVRAFTGTETTYLDDMTAVYVNFIIFFEIMLLPLLFDLYFRSKKDKNVQSNVIVKNLISYIMSIMILMQLTGFVSAYITNDPSMYKKDYKGRVLSFKPMFSLSKEHNICVFLMDRTDTFWLDELLEIYPGVKEDLRGFTYYRNNVSHYEFTYPTLATMLTGTLCNTKDDLNKALFFNSVWEGKTPLDRLKDNGYYTYYQVDRACTFADMDYFARHADNTVIPEGTQYTIDYPYIVKIMLKYSASRLLPYSLKYQAAYDMPANVTQTFITYSYPGGSSEYIPQSNIKVDMAMYDYMNTYGMNADSDKKVFTFHHMNGAHDPLDDVAALSPEEPLAVAPPYGQWGNDVARTLRGEFRIFSEYVQKTKELGIYDNTTFIIMADHGKSPDGDYDSITEAMPACLLIRPAHEPDHPLQYNDTAPLSNDMFSASILELAGIEHDDVGLSYFDVISGDLNVVRYNELVTKDEIFEIRGDAKDFSNWKLVPKSEDRFPWVDDRSE